MSDVDYDALRAAAEAMERMSEKERDVQARVLLYGQSVEQVAQETGIEPSVVRAMLAAK